MAPNLAGWIPTLPEDYIASLVDVGRWRELGITHWHLWSRDMAKSDTTRRFSAEIVAEFVYQGEPETDPKAALRWVYSRHIEAITSSSDPTAVAAQRGWHTEKDLLLSLEVSWELMTERPYLYTPIGGGLEARKDRSLDVYAEPMTKDRCRRHAAAPEPTEDQ